MKTQLHTKRPCTVQTLLLVLMFIFVATIQAQDEIILRSGNVVSGKVTEINLYVVRYHPTGTPDNLVEEVAKSEVFRIKFQNGVSQVFGQEPAPAVRSTQANTKLDADSLVPKHVKYGGPRFGCTIIGDGTMAKYLIDRGKNPFVTQFGWQFETRVFSSRAGISGLIEFVALAAGLEQGMFLPSGTLMFGFRGKNAEFAVGPNLSYTGVGMAFAFGTSVRVEDVYFPITVAFVPSVSSRNDVYDPNTNTTSHVTSSTGMRLSVLIGFNTRKRS